MATVFLCKFLVFLVKPYFFEKLLAGLEPATYSLRMSCATNCATEAFKNALDEDSPKALYDLTGNRTRVYAVRGRRLNRLTMRPQIVWYPYFQK